MEMTMNVIYASSEIHLTEQALQAKEICWSLNVLAFCGGQPEANYEQLTFKISRSTWGSWEINDDGKREMISVLSLWMLHFREDERGYRNLALPSREGGIAKSIVWPDQRVDDELFRLWVGHHGVRIQAGNLRKIMKVAEILLYRLIWKPEVEGAFADIATTAILPDGSPLEKHFAQQIFSEFFSAVVPSITEISGSTNIYPGFRTVS